MNSKGLHNTSSVDRALRCNHKGCVVSFMLCPLCEKYPCNQLTSEEIEELHWSPLMDRLVKKFIPRRCKMFIVKYLDGTLKEVPELDPNNPDKELMKDVETVYQIGKELVPVIVLKPKSKTERDSKKAAEKKAKK